MLMPVIEIKVRNTTNLDKFGIIKNDSNKTENIWDNSYQLDLKQLSRYINIVVHVNNKTDG